MKIATATMLLQGHIYVRYGQHLDNLEKYIFKYTHCIIFYCKQLAQYFTFLNNKLKHCIIQNQNQNKWLITAI